MAERMKRCIECREGSGFRLDLVEQRDGTYRCPACGTAWQWSDFYPGEPPNA